MENNNDTIDLDLKNIFIIFLISGGLSIFIGYHVNLGLIQSLIVPIFSILAYAYIGSKKTEQAQGLEEVADTSYYLGFIFTLFAMISSLFILNDSDAASGSMLGSFGLALVTTVLGLIIKIYLTSFTEDISAARSASSRTLEKNTRKFVSSLNKNSRALDSHYSSMEGSIIGMKAQSEKSINEILGFADENIKRSTLLFSSGMRDAIVKIDEKIDSFEVSEGILSNEIRPALDNFNDVLKNYTDNELKPALFAFREQLSGYTSSVKKQKDQIDRAIEQSDLLDETFKYMGEFSKVIEEATKAYSTVSQVADQSQAAFELQVTAIEKFTGGQIDALKKFTDQNITNLERISKSIETVESKLLSSVTEQSELSNSIKQVSKEMSSYASVVSELAQDAKFSIQYMREFRRESDENKN